jgi:hypothetical protein
VYDADFRGRIDGAKGQSMTSVGEVTAEEGRGRFFYYFIRAPSRESNRQSLAYETCMVPQDHCQRTRGSTAALMSLIKLLFNLRRSPIQVLNRNNAA